MAWSEEQELVLTDISEWYKDFRKTSSPVERRKKQIFRLFGPAGTGKTTLACEIENIIDRSAQYAAYTGKAAMVMRGKKCHNATTLHSLIYKANVNPRTGEITFSLNNDSPLLSHDILVVDECSMVDDDMAEDILSFKKPVLVLGDPNQLPPVSKGEGFFTREAPNFTLNQIHRQARDNPIIHLSVMVRENQPLKKGNYGGVQITDTMSKEDLVKYDQTITGTVRTRQKYNEIAREILERNYTPFPVPGEKIIGLRNDREVGIFNGLFYYVDKIGLDLPKAFNMRITDEFSGKPIEVRCHKSKFDPSISASPDWRVMKKYQDFDYAYAITCHKAQGSQFSSLLVKDESKVFGDKAKNWLYTAITRASTENVKIVLPK